MDRQSNLLFIKVRIFINTHRVLGRRIISCYSWSQLRRRQHLTPLGSAAKFTNKIPLGNTRDSALWNITHTRMSALHIPGTYLYFVVCKCLQTSLKESWTMSSTTRLQTPMCHEQFCKRLTEFYLSSWVYDIACKGTRRMSKKTTYLTAVPTLLSRKEV